MLRVSDIVTIEEIEKWGAGDCITVKAGTGIGKSWLIKNSLYNIAKQENKRILMLIHRCNCTEQFIDEITRDNKTDVIDIKTYQKLEYKELHRYKNDLSEYQYIVCDEFHYFMSDAAFSKTTDMSLDLILGQQFVTKIFMSATGDDMKRYINEFKDIRTIDYELPIEFNFINSLSFFYNDDTFENFMEEIIKRKEKAIFFIQSAKKAYELYQKYKDNCLFNCSKNNSDYYKYVDKEKIKNMLTNEKFEDLILITTTCMDAGVNLIDLELKHIICEVEDTGTLIQCIGRKRIQNENDNINLYIKIISNNFLGGKETQIKKRLLMANFLKKHTIKEFILEFPRQYDFSNIVYDVVVKENDKSTKKINGLMVFKCEEDLKEIELIKDFGKYGYCEYLKNIFCINFYRVIEEQNKIDQLEKYLESIVGKKLFKEEQKELAKLVNIKRDGKLLKSYGSLNAYFLEDNINFIIKTNTDWNRKLDDGTKNKQYGKTYWIVCNIDK